MGHRWVNYKNFDAIALIEDYKNLINVGELSKKYKISKDRIRRCLIKNNIERLSKSEFCIKVNSTRYSFEDELVKDYLNNVTVNNIEKKYNIGTRKINNILNRNNIVIRRGTVSATLAWKTGSRICTGFNRTGTKNLFGSILSRWKANAEARDYCFLVSKEYLQSIYEKQCGLCAYTGMKMLSPITHKDFLLSAKSPYIISLDRINNDLDYIEGNVQFILSWLNKAKGNMEHDKFSKIIEDLKEHFICNNISIAV